MSHTTDMSSLSKSFPLWPGNAPGTSSDASEFLLTESGGDSIHGVRIPTLTPFLPAAPIGSAVIVVPGGAYSKLVFEKEGCEIARWLNSLGITAFVLKYRLLVEGHEQPHLVALQDLQRAIRLVRSRCTTFGLTPARIGVLGCSSGGHLAACAGTAFSCNTYTAIDGADRISARPDFMVLLYGPYTGNMFYSHASREQLFFPQQVKNKLYAKFPVHLQVTHDSPPTLLIAGNDKRVSPENSSAMFLALMRAGVPVQLHIFSDGGHGFALRTQVGTCTAKWPSICQDWLVRHKVLPRA